MTNLFIVLSVLAVALAQEYEILDNAVDFEDPQYQRISLPYPYQDDTDVRVVKLHSKPIKNAILLNNGFEEIKHPVNQIHSTEVKTSLSSINTSLINTICAVATKLLGVLKIALKLMILKIPALIFGAVLVIGFCKITSVCTKIGNIQSLIEAKKELVSFITPERLDMVSEFIQEAIRRYRSLQ